MNNCLNDQHTVFSVKADDKLLKSVWECSNLKVSQWKMNHPSDTEDKQAIGLTSEDEAESLEAAARVARCRFGGSLIPEAQPSLVLPEHHPTDDEVVVKKRTLKCVKQQVLALLCGEDLPEGAQAREVAEVLYEGLAVPRGETTCFVCRQVFKTHHCAAIHMGIHRDEKFPCHKCGKVLANKRTWTEHTKACVQGNWVSCPVCGQEYASALIMCQHHQAKHGVDAAVLQGGFVCPFCGKVYQIKNTWWEHKPYCPNNPDRKGPYYCRVAGCPSAGHPFTRVRNLNFHMSNMHGWKEQHT